MSTRCGPKAPRRHHTPAQPAPEVNNEAVTKRALFVGQAGLRYAGGRLDRGLYSP